MNFPRKIKVLFYRIFSEKRKYIRVPISVKVTNINSGAFSYYHATNISIGGMFIKSGEPLEKDSELNLHFTLPNPVEKEIRVKAEVVRIQNSDPDNPSYSSGMGIRFLNLSDHDREAIEAFIKIKT